MTTDLMKLRELAAIVYSGCCTAKAVDEYRELTNPAKVIALLDALEALGREVERLTNNFKVNLNALHKAADERDTLRAELAAIRAQDLHDLLKGKLVSMDVSTSEDDAYNRVFGRVCEVMLQSCGAEEDTILAIEESRNFASPADKDAGLVTVPLEFVQGFNTLAHNYSLQAVAPDFYHGVERDAFCAAYKRCGQSLAELREKLGGV
ncbi:hypothetical protein CHU94_08065 [Rhodoferax sp. TH121]|uniref:hypothetical protein n=1 Tax=Rhodoferax sp. TH121 TaxID=2022803 RepID=UPI000B96C622|nr:hypothetical protein [Rhodoferax sp. TH121]OYQ41057.1 hypothetical protein CHU94_08065 [Rhodoferax sp. TH121]